MPFWNRRYVRIKFITFQCMSMNWAVGCYLGRDKTIEKVSSRFYWRNNSKSVNEYQEGTGKDKFYNGKKIDIIIFVCHVIENTILDRYSINVASSIISDV